MAGELSALKEIDPSRYVVYIGFLIILVAFSIVLRDSGFLTTRNLLNIVQQTAPVTVMAVGMGFVLSAAESALSIGSIVAISALLASMVLRSEAWIIGAAAGLAAGLVIGAVHGALVAFVRLPSFLVTLATMCLLAGVARWLTNLQSVPITNVFFNDFFGAGALGGVPSLVLWTIAVVGVGHFFFAESRFGAHVHAIGDNASGSRAVGIHVERIR